MYKGSKIGNWYWISIIILLIILAIAIFFVSNVKQNIIGIIALITLYFMIIIGIMICVLKIVLNKKRYLIIEGDYLKLPFTYKYKYPYELEVNKIHISSTSIINSSNKNEKVVQFLKNNPAPIFSIMIDHYEYQRNPSKYLILKTEIGNSFFYIVLVKFWFDNLEEFSKYF